MRQQHQRKIDDGRDRRDVALQVERQVLEQRDVERGGGRMNSMVLPSGGALTTAWIEMLVLAPGLFSMTTGWPSRSASHAAMMRATMSPLPPGGNPTTHRSGCEGQVCALATPPREGASTGAAAAAVA
jgi:hypothetical protein